MVNRKNWLGILAIVLVFGMMVFGCDNDSTSSGGDGNSNANSNGESYGDSNGNGNVPKTLVITGVPATEGEVTFTGKQITVAIFAKAKHGDLQVVALNQVNINSTTITTPLLSATTEAPFTGTGDFYIWIFIDVNNTKNDLSDDTAYVYTGGGSSAIPYNFTNATTTIPFSQFKMMNVYWETTYRISYRANHRKLSPQKKLIIAHN